MQYLVVSFITSILLYGPLHAAVFILHYVSSFPEFCIVFFGILRKKKIGV